MREEEKKPEKLDGLMKEIQREVREVREEEGLYFLQETEEEEPVLTPIAVEEEEEEREEEEENFDWFEQSEAYGEVVDTDALFSPLESEEEKEEIYLGGEKWDHRVRWLSIFLLSFGLFCIILIGVGVFYIKKSQREILLSSRAAVDLSMALLHSQVHSPSPGKEPFVSFLSSHLQRIIASPYRSPSFFNPEGGVEASLYELQLFLGEDPSSFVIFVQPRPHFSHFFTGCRELVIESHHMKLYSVKNLEKWREALNLSPQHSLDLYQTKELLREAIPISLYSLDGADSLGYTPSEDLRLFSPEIEERVYHAPRYYLWTHTFSQNLLQLYENLSFKEVFLSFQREINFFLSHPNMLLYTLGEEERALKLYEILYQLHLSSMKLLYGYFSINPVTGMIQSNRLVSLNKLQEMTIQREEEEKESLFVREKFFSWKESQLPNLSEEERTEYRQHISIYSSTFSSLLAAREREIHTLSENLRNNIKVSEEQWKERNRLWKKHRERHKQIIGKQMTFFYQEQKGNKLAFYAFLEVMYSLNLQNDLPSTLWPAFEERFFSSLSEKFSHMMDNLSRAVSLEEIFQQVKETKQLIEEGDEEKSSEGEHISLFLQLREHCFRKLYDHFFSENASLQEDLSHVYEQTLFEEILHEIRGEGEEKRRFFFYAFDQLSSKIKQLLSTRSMINLKRAQKFLSVQTHEEEGVIDQSASENLYPYIQHQLKEQEANYQRIARQIRQIPIHSLSVRNREEKREIHSRWGIQILVEQSLYAPSPIRDKQVLDALQILYPMTDFNRLIWEYILEGRRMLTERVKLEIYKIFQSRVGFYPEEEIALFQMKKLLEEYLHRKKRLIHPLSKEQRTFIQTLQGKTLEQVFASLEEYRLLFNRLIQLSEEYRTLLEALARDYSLAKKEGLFIHATPYHYQMQKKLSRKIALFKEWNHGLQNTLRHILRALASYQEIIEREREWLAKDEESVKEEEIYALQAQMNAIVFPYLSKENFPKRYDAIISTEIIPLSQNEREEGESL